jgi:3-methyladenine DNA glycosylase Mpg
LIRQLKRDAIKDISYIYCFYGSTPLLNTASKGKKEGGGLLICAGGSMSIENKEVIQTSGKLKKTRVFCNVIDTVL